MNPPSAPAVREWRRGEYLISTDPARLDLELVHDFLSRESYWARGMPFEVMRRSIEHSLPFGLYRESGQVGFARAVTDYAVFAYVGDVFVLPAHRGRGLSKWLMETMLAHPDLQRLRRWNLATRDAHGLYRRFGFASAGPNTMDRVDPDPYPAGSEER
jgi:GNAT superfamily N-acetyltransferase